MLNESSSARSAAEYIRPTSILIGAAYGISALWALYLIWAHLNYLQVDIPGHIASASEMANGLYHRFEDHFFLGFIHGLFYPPLEDALLAALGIICRHDWILADKIYFSLIACGFMFSLWRVNRDVLSSTLSRSLFCLGALLLFHLDKSHDITYQGLSLDDLIKTGLSSEFLGAIFLLELVRAWHLKRRWPWLAVWITGILLSHIIISVVAAIMILCLWTDEPKARIKDWLKAGMLAMGLTCFYWLPFIAHSSMVVSSRILQSPSEAWLFVLLLIIIFDRRARPLGLAAMILIGSCVVGRWIPTPNFHYYRLMAPAFILALIAFTRGLDAQIAGGRLKIFFRSLLKLSTPAWMATLAFVLTLVLGYKEFSLERYDLSGAGFTATSFDFSSAPSVPEDQIWRYWFIGSRRTPDFGLESLLSLQDHALSSNKGLYWESHRSHVLVTSYLASLLGVPVVLDFFRIEHFDCEFRKCLIDQFAHDFALRGLVVDPQLNIRYLAPDDRACYSDILAHGTKNFTLAHKADLKLNAVTNSVFDFVPREGSHATQEAIVQYVTASGFQVGSARDFQFYGRVVNDLSKACFKGITRPAAYVDRDSLNLSGLNLDQAVGASKLADVFKEESEHPPEPQFKRLTTGDYEITLPTDAPRLISIRLAYFPGVHLRDDEGHELPLIEAVPGMLAFAKGHLHLTYERTAAMRTGYAVSAALMLVLMAWGLLNTRKKRRS